ncbi:hypothetical protein PGT21_034811 [Puccinia graminis f. sp. tritici]|uniref:Uncharacterized protein n=1 Tax=Puccinia graminis f. sp. tritici TaxID=56615 RepID=A0A5B0LZA9_PUCGR|nr:hypothetical protein PGT21_034811 [Puccinia graminis f. sp. tritici]
MHASNPPQHGTVPSELIPTHFLQGTTHLAKIRAGTVVARRLQLIYFNYTERKASLIDFNYNNERAVSQQTSHYPITYTTQHSTIHRPEDRITAHASNHLRLYRTDYAVVTPPRTTLYRTDFTAVGWLTTIDRLLIILTWPSHQPDHSSLPSFNPPTLLTFTSLDLPAGRRATTSDKHFPIKAADHPSCHPSPRISIFSSIRLPQHHSLSRSNRPSPTPQVLRRYFDSIHPPKQIHCAPPSYYLHSTLLCLLGRRGLATIKLSSHHFDSAHQAGRHSSLPPSLPTCLYTVLGLHPPPPSRFVVLLQTTLYCTKSAAITSIRPSTDRLGCRGLTTIDLSAHHFDSAY